MYSIKEAEQRIKKRRVVAVLANSLLIAVSTGLIAYFYFLENELIDHFFLMKSFMVVVVAFGLMATVTSSYRNSTIRLVMPYVITKFEDRFGKDFAYSREYDLPKRMLNQSGLVDASDRVKCSDMIKVQFPGGDKMSLCNVKTYRVTRDKDGKEKEHLVDSGIFVKRITDMDTGTYFVIRDKTYFAKNIMILKGKELYGVSKVQPSFDKHYRLYTSDSIKTFRFLSPSVIEKFMEMANVKGHVSELSLFDNEVFLFINGAEIEVVVQSLFIRPNIDKMIQESYDNINEVLNMVDFVYNEQRITRLSKEKKELE